MRRLLGSALVLAATTALAQAPAAPPTPDAGVPPAAAAQPPPDSAASAGDVEVVSEGDASSGEGAEFRQELVITATRRPESLATLPGSVTVVGAEQLRPQASQRNLGEALGPLVPGLALGSQGSSTFGQTLRGRNVLVMIDGVPQSSVRNVQHDLAGIDPSAVERVEVLRGATAVYGEGASGGIIHIITRRPGQGPARLATSLDVGASTTHPARSVGATLTQRAEGSWSGLEYSLSGALSQTGRAYDAEGDLIPPDPQGQGGLADVRSYNLFAKLGIRPGEGQRLRLMVNHLDGVQATDFTSDPSVNALPPGSTKARALEGLQLQDPQGTRNTTASLVFDDDDVWGGSSFRAQAFVRNHRTRFFPFDGRTMPAYGRNIIQSRLETLKVGGRLELGGTVAERFSVLTGLDAVHERTEQPVSLLDGAAYDASGGLTFNVVTPATTWVPDTRVTSLAPFVQGEWQATGRLTLRAGVRFEATALDVPDYTTLAGNPIVGAAQRFGRPLVNAGAIYGVTEAVSVFANASQGFALPDVGLILRNAPAGSTVASLNVKPSRVDNVETGVRAGWERVQSSLSVFASRSPLGSSSAGLGAPIVRAPEHVYGLEATLDVQPTDTLRAGTTFSWMEGRVRKTPDADLSWLNNYRIAPPKLTVSLEHETLPGWKNGVLGIYSHSRTRFAQTSAVVFGEEDVGAFFTADLTSRAEVGPGTLSFAVTNLFNRSYYTRESQLLRSLRNDTHTAALGRAVSLGYELRY